MTHRLRPSLAWLAAAALVSGACAAGTTSTEPSAAATPATTPAASPIASPGAAASPAPGALVRIPGTRVSMVPQGAFVAATNFDGFGDPSGAAIEVTDVAQPFSVLAPQVTVEELASQGITVQTRDERKLADGHDSVLLSGTQNIEGRDTQKIILVTGDEESSVLITANIPFSSPDGVEPAALAMLLSTVLHPAG